ncbi:universal stress protein [Actinoplanes sp. NBRC 14428]|uniref:Universal stress protein family protein n=1 Tax=Pseudosporangium ferrugineum TaxID=439699 RepID=A0A2T0SHM4_9ACTN|nr:universal stress protein [Pseudosporangium ferrugineum]PRY32918.1 universal stress protein family protein [Pseudosporangium ferrugineum]BCJ49121.1 universal stress protein [Actinoplanes sp. NBRC 14428]
MTGALLEPVRRSPYGLATVVAGVDGTATGELVLERAMIEADLRGWHLRLLHVQPEQDAPGRDEVRDRGARLLERMTDQAHAASAVVAVTSRLLVGPVAERLLSAAGAADLLVVGGRPDAEAAGPGVAVRVAARHGGPVLVVRPPEGRPGPARSGGGSRKPVVLGVVDGAGDAAAVTEFALGEARLRGCDAVQLHTGAARGEWDEAAGDVVVRHRLLAGDPAEALVRASAGACAVVLGRRGPSGRGRLLGPVGDALVRHAACPVFLVG